MPVHVQHEGGLLQVVLDGDFTTGEMRRVVGSGLGGAETGDPVALLVDCSGAAGLGRMDPEELDDMAAFLGARAARIRRVAFLAPGDPAYDLMHAVSLRAGGHGVEASVFRTRGEADRWLS